MMRNQILRALALGLLCLGAPAYAAAAKPAPAESVSPRKEARARFVAYLDSEHHQSKLDATGKQQLFSDLRAKLKTFATLVDMSTDAALLLEMKRLHTGTPSVELTTRYGAKLILVRVPNTSMSQSQPIKPSILMLNQIDAAGHTVHVGEDDLTVFGITKPKHFKELLEKAMERLAPEDYTK